MLSLKDTDDKWRDRAINLSKLIGVALLAGWFVFKGGSEVGCGTETKTVIIKRRGKETEERSVHRIHDLSLVMVSKQNLTVMVNPEMHFVGVHIRAGLRDFPHV